MKFPFRHFALFLLFSLISINSSFARGRGLPDSLSENASLSLLTAEPGAELYAAFGHSAFRLQDPAAGLDVVFNYGIFDFGAPNFYLNFVKGKLMYRMGASTYDGFYRMYTREQRTLYENQLLLSPAALDSVYEFLSWNYLPENQVYLYDFFFDNCATRLRDIIENQYGDKLTLNQAIGDRNLSFRDALDEFLWCQPWGHFGIDLALGSVIDRKMTAREYTFHPVYMLQTMQKWQISTEGKDTPLLGAQKTVLDLKPGVTTGNWFSNPLFICGLVLLLTILITFFGFRSGKRFKAIDFSMFLIFGFAGTVLLLLWVATDHSATARNFNILWCNPIFIPLAFLVWPTNRKAWMRMAFLISGIIIVLTILLSPLIIQKFHPSFFLLMGALAIRCFAFYRQP